MNSLPDFRACFLEGSLCAYCGVNEGRVIWKNAWLCPACTAAVVRFQRELNEWPTALLPNRPRFTS